MITRRSFAAGGALALQACSRPKGSAFDGYAFVANEEGKAVAAVDLTAFAVTRHIHLDGKPTAIVAPHGLPSVYALTPETGAVHEINAAELAFRRKHQAAASAVSMRLDQGGEALWVLCREPRQLIRLRLETLRTDARVPLPADPIDFDLSPAGDAAAVSFGTAGLVCMVDLEKRRALKPVGTGAAGVVRFRSDGRYLLVANVGDRMLSIYEAETMRVVTHLPLPVKPENLCFNADGGQLFITGEGMDAVSVIYPHRVPQVAGTLLAGHAPGYMAASAAPSYLFIANPADNGLTIMDIGTQRVRAVVNVGREPGYIAITPDNQYALVLNRRSGDMSVIRIAAVTTAEPPMKRMKSAPLFTMIPVGSKPVSMAVRAV